MKATKVKEIVESSISTYTNETDLKLTKILNTQNFNGKINGLPFSPLTYEGYLKNKRDYLDLNLILQTLRAYFVETFKWNGLKQKEMRRVESLLFFNGKCALIKQPDGTLYITDYSTDKGLFDNYGYPKSIEVIDTKNEIMNGKNITKNFAVIYGHVSKQALPLLIWKRLMSYLEALRRMDVVNRTSDTKILISDNADDLMYNDLNSKWYSEQPFLKINTDIWNTTKMEHISLADNAKTKMELLLFHLNLILTYLGLKTGDLVEKAERQTEMEIANNDKFNGKLLSSMYSMRVEGSEEIKEKLGLNIVPVEPIITEEENEKSELNGEENKNKIEGEKNV